jgi:hypothetical protein
MVLGAVMRRTVVTGFILLMCLHLLLTQNANIPARMVTATAITVALAWGGYAKQSLDISGVSRGTISHVRL